MEPRINYKPGDQENQNNVLHDYAVDGLRTLVMGKRKLEEAEFRNFQHLYNERRTSTSINKEEELNELYDHYEKGLELVGASAIEDKLQDEVPETIALLIDAGIRVWVLTGDKQETAVEIGKSCRLIQSNMKLYDLSSDSKQELMQKLAEYKREIVRALIFNIQPQDMPEVIKSLDDVPQLKDPISIVINGKSLGFVLEDEALQRDFFRFGLLAASVLCCRVSPKQKSEVVLLSKRIGKWITLSVGDGANDVSMIIEAHIGVGIRGKEGTQAVRSADYAVGQFRFLQRLLLVHGRMGYRRVAFTVCYYFYKNVVLVFTEIYFALYNGFSGQIFFADWLPMLYNALWTSLTCLFAYALEKDVDDKLSIQHAKDVYPAGPKQRYFNYFIFWKWVGFSLWHGLVTFFFVSIGLSGPNNGDGETAGMWYVSCTAFSCIIQLVTYKLILEVVFLNWIVQ